MDSGHIDIVVPEERLAANEAVRARLAAWQRFEVQDRTPVQFSLGYRYLRTARGAPIGDYFADPRAQMEQQLLNHKWMLEHIRDDRVIDTERVVVHPDLQDIRGGYFPIRTIWTDEVGPMAEPLL